MPTTESRDPTAGPFITRVVQRVGDGHRLVHLSRRHRKRLPPYHLTAEGLRVSLVAGRSAWLRVWAPGRLAWWIAVLFMIGAACFAGAGFAANWPGLLPPQLTHAALVNRVFFVGSIFFTSAAALQLLEAVNGDVAEVGTGLAAAGRRRAWRWIAWKPHNAGYMAGLIQLTGTVLFSFSIGDALLACLPRGDQAILIWTPNMLGSVCFLVAGYLALIEVAHGFWTFEPRRVAWWIAVVNLLGASAFQVAAVCGVFLPVPDEGRVWDAGLWTFVGALCFLVGAWLLIPELFDADAAAPVRAVEAVAGPPETASREAAGI